MADSASAAHPLAQGLPRQPAYSEDARSYDRGTGAFESYRRAIVEALPVRRGQVVLDVGCGTGLCCGLLLEKVGPQGAVIGIEESPEMATIARERIAREGRPWNHLEQLLEDVHFRELALGCGYVLTGRSGGSRRPGSRRLPGAAGSRASRRLALRVRQRQ